MHQLKGRSGKYKETRQKDRMTYARAHRYYVLEAASGMDYLHKYKILIHHFFDFFFK
jgi:hypothetical protein